MHKQTPPCYPTLGCSFHYVSWHLPYWMCKLWLLPPKPVCCILFFLLYLTVIHPVSLCHILCHTLIVTISVLLILKNKYFLLLSFQKIRDTQPLLFSSLSKLINSTRVICFLFKARRAIPRTCSKVPLEHVLWSPKLVKAGVILRIANYLAFC